jgi:hypothetical protein
MWWPAEPVSLNRKNSSFPKEKYRFFWTMLFHKCGFLDERYKTIECVLKAYAKGKLYR